MVQMVLCVYLNGHVFGGAAMERLIVLRSVRVLC